MGIFMGLKYGKFKLGILYGDFGGDFGWGFCKGILKGIIVWVFSMGI